MASTFWERLPERARGALREAGSYSLVRPGTFLMREHTRSSQVCVLFAGAVKIWVDRAGEVVILDVLGPGDVLGELEAADGGVRYANAEALTAVEALGMPADRFRAVLDSCAGSVWTVAEVLADRLRAADDLQTGHFPDDPARRLAARLLRLADRLGTDLPGGGVVIQVPLCQQDLGRWSGMGRRKVAQLLASEPFRSVAVTRNVITVRSPADLRRLLDETDPA
ncbi:Crp/Fnr family transcriptional regulator [Actinomadura kijaniata]|uniref:Crp/Fnr family transcriptional regulator n=1 Tax=Actinomadura kijaniata TaxID=46161 RepID=UPI000834C098|nr:Crp/Fnr family transcriptional regulator [Actinomadura kijaniata]